jgi:hypothetical protein
MNVSRREFILVGAAGAIGAGTAGCSKDQPAGTPEGSQPAARATTRLSVLISGLVGVVSNGPTDLLLIDGDMTLQSPHAPRLFAPTTAVAADSTSPSGTTGTRSFWDLKYHRVTLISGATTGTTRVTGVRGPNEQTPANPNSERDVSWLAQMSKIPGAGAGRINPQCLADDPRAARVASRVRFTGGEVAARFKPPFHQVVWQIGQSGASNPFKQALGELTLSQTIPADRVVFRLEPFDPGPSKDIVLAPSTGVNLEVEVANLPGHVDCSSASEANNLAHFAAFYELLAEPASAKPIPSCQSNCPSCPAAGEIVYCPPADYAP